jgi:DNA polymerase (family 10)
MSSDRRLPLDQAATLAAKIKAALAPYCRRIEIAGSIRRQRAYCGDVDLVCIPAGLTGREEILKRCEVGARRVKGGEQYVVYELANGFQLDLWFAHEGTGDLLEPEPSNFGMVLLARTGSAEHNTWLAEEARRKHLHFHPSRGLLKAGKVFASAEEAEIFTTLGLEWVPPERRER